MGVRGLVTFLEDKPVWENLELSDTRLVIDGGCLFYHLYFDSWPLDYVYCGQYRKYVERVKSFFEKLREHNITPYVVMDGVLDVDKKLDTITSRRNDKLAAWSQWFVDHENDNRTKALSGVPSLARLCFVETLQEMKVNLAIGDNESDRDVASLSREWKCPAVAKDSDYFIFNTGQYYIPLDKLNWSVGRDEPIISRACKSEKVAEFLGVSVDLLPLLASLSGNDYTQHKNFFRAKGGNRFVELARVLSSATTPDEGLAAVNHRYLSNTNRKIQLDDISESLEEYEITGETNLKDWFDNGHLKTVIKSFQPHPWLLRLFREGRCSGQFLEVLCNRMVILDLQPEDMREASSNCCSLPLRRRIYELLLPPGQRKGISEWDRVKSQLKRRSITLTEDQPEIVLPSARSEKNRREALLQMLGVEIPADIPEEWKLPIAVLKYWCKNAVPWIESKHLEALLIVHATSIQMNIAESEPIFDPRTLHAFAQWKSVLKTVICLNTLLQCPFPPPRIHELFDGPTAFKVLIKLRNGEVIDIEEEEERRLFEKLKAAVQLS